MNATAVCLRASDIRFEADVHRYTLPDGTPVPSVTDILSAVGVSMDFEAIGAMSSKLSDDIAIKRQIGTAVHLDAHAYDDDDLLWNTVDPSVEPYVRAWATFRENSGLTPMTRERRVFHPGHFYCGTLDGIFLTPKRVRVLVDIKTGDPADSGCQFQTAAYQAAHALEHPDEPIAERWAVRLTPALSVPYRVTKYDDWRDFGVFQAFVTTFHHQSLRRRSAK